MKVYLVTSSSIPNGMASTKRIKCLARAIAFANINVEVLVYMRTERFGIKPKNIEAKGSFDGVNFRYIGNTPLRASYAIIRKYYDYADKSALLKYLHNNLKPNDIVFMYDGNQWKFSCKLAKLAHRHGAFYVKDLCEYPYGEDLETESRKKNRVNVFNKEFPLIDAITPISTGLLEIAKQYANKECKLLKIPILVDFEKYKLDDKSEYASFPYIFHSGTLTEQKDGILGIIKAFGEVHKKISTNLQFISTGKIENSLYREDILNLINQYNLHGKIHFLGYVDEEVLKDYLSKSTMVIINKYENMQNYCCFSTKLGEYLSACKPVILTDYGEAPLWVKDKQSAYIVKSGNNIEIQNAIIYILSHRLESLEVALNGQQVCKNSFDFRVWSKPLKELFESL